MVTHSSILAWRIPWMEEPGGLQFMGPAGGARRGGRRPEPPDGGWVEAAPGAGCGMLRQGEA